MNSSTIYSTIFGKVFQTSENSTIVTPKSVKRPLNAKGHSSGSSGDSVNSTPKENQSKKLRACRRDLVGEFLTMEDEGSETRNNESMEEMMNRLLANSERRTISTLRDVIKEEIQEQLEGFKLLTEKVEEVNEEVQAVKTSVHQLEAAARRNNLIIQGIAENEKETHSDRHEALQKLAKRLKIDNFDYSECIRLGKNGHYSRPLLVKMLRYRDKMEVKAAARHLKGSKIYINDDMSPQERQADGILRKKRREIMGRDKNAKCSIKAVKLFVQASGGSSSSVYYADLTHGEAKEQTRTSGNSQLAL